MILKYPKLRLSDSVVLERFQAKACPGLDPGWKPVRVKKTRQIKNLEPRFDSIETEKALNALVRCLGPPLPGRFFLCRTGRWDVYDVDGAQRCQNLL